MGVFCILVLAFVLTSGLTSGEAKNISCQDDICDVISKLEILEIFATDHNLESGHKALKKELETMGHIMTLGKDKPLQTYLIRYQKKIQEETYIKMEGLFDDEADYISHEFRDLEKVVKEQDKKLDAMQVNLERKLEDQHNNNIAKFDHLQKTMDKKLEEQDYNITEIFYVLNGISEKLDDMQINLSEEIKNLGSPINNTIDQETQTVVETTTAPEPETTTTPEPETTTMINVFDCLEILEAGENKSGVYTINPQGYEFDVYCDMTTSGGGWTVFLNRMEQEPQLDFKRNWQEYKNGFGLPSGELWLGNEILHLMTAAKPYSLRVDIVGNGTPMDNWVEYSIFKVDSEDSKYQLTLDVYNDNSTMKHETGFAYNSKQYFTTIDVCNDNGDDDENCAKDMDQWSGMGGGFWYDYCSFIFPTKPYGLIDLSDWSKADRSHKRSVSSLEMKIRPMK